MDMVEVRIHGRSGQGAQVAGQMLAAAFVRSGRHVQAFAAYGGERRGAPVTAFLRVDDRPIRLRCDIERPHHVVVLDPTLIGDVADVEPGGLVVVNSPEPAPVAPAGGRLVGGDRRHRPGIRHIELAGPAANNVQFPAGKLLVAEQLADRRKISETIGLTADVTVVFPKILERSAGKAKRVLDLRSHP